MTSDSMQLAMADIHSPNPIITGLLADMPPDVRATFSSSQLAALDTSLSRTPHLIDFRVSIPTLTGSRYYVTLLAGRERRNLSRLHGEGQTRVTRIAIFYSVLTAMLGGLLLFGMFCALYLLKSYSDINLFEGESALHPLFTLLPKH